MAVKRQSTLFDFAKEAGPSIVASKRRKSAEESSASTNNAITVEKPSGSTTIIINNNCSASELNSEPLTTGQHIDTIDVQSDISEPSAQLCDVARSPNTPPVQPIDLVFPNTVCGDKQRSFNPEWFKSYKWLEYSAMKDAAFCYPCRLFPTKEGRSHDTFTKTGYRDWKHATGKGSILSVHDKCATHITAMNAWTQYRLNSQCGTSIAQRIGTSHSQLVTNNRHYIKSVIEVLLLCGCQEIALRGHRESRSSLKRGNFLEILHLVASHDSVVQNKLQHGPRNAMYTSPEIQNVLLHIIGQMIRKRICAEVSSARLFSILADESKDCAKTKQLAIVLRYVKEAKVHERFLTFVPVSKLDAQSLTDAILGELQSYGLNLDSIVSQGYDGASVMSGRCSGVQARVAEVVPQAIYIHCFAHVLNLVLVDSAKAISDAADFFALLEALYVFVSSTKAHSVFISKQKELHHDKPTRELQQLSDTRWACRHSAVDALCYTYDALLATLEVIADGENHSKAIEARGLLFQVQSFQFILLLVLFDRILSCTKQLSDLLQSPNCDLAVATNLVSATIETLEEFRSDISWDHLFQYAKQVARKNGIDNVSICSRRKTRTPRRLDDFVSLEPESTRTGTRESMSTSQELKVNLYYPILDKFLTELNQCFSGTSIGIMKAIQACCPQSKTFLDTDHLQPLVSTYSLDQVSLSMETTIAKRTLSGKIESMQSISELFLELQPLRVAFPTLHKLIQIALTICVTSAECERCFSALKRIKSYLRSSMTEERLVDSASISIERDFAQEMSIEEIIDQFSASDRNRRIILH